MTAIGAFAWGCTMPLHSLSSAAHPFLGHRGAQWYTWWFARRLYGGNQSIVCLLAWFKAYECEVPSCRPGRPFWKTDSGRSIASEGEGVGRRVQFAPQDTTFRYRSSHGISSHCIELFACVLDQLLPQDVECSLQRCIASSGAAQILAPGLSNIDIICIKALPLIGREAAEC